MKMLTTYLALYALLAVVGIVEIATGILKNVLGMGVHIFFALFTIIFIIQTVSLWRHRSADTDPKARVAYNTHRLTLILVTLLILLVWLFAV